MKTLITLAILIGYIFNMYFLTVDLEVREHQWVNKVGVVLFPLGSIMGYVYILDKHILIKKEFKNEN